MAISANLGGGTRNWSDTATWDGGVVPTAADDVILSSFSGNVTIDAGAVCRSLDCTVSGNYGGVLSQGSGVTLTIGDGTAGGSNVALKLTAGMTYAPNAASTISFISTSSTQQTINCAGKTLGIVTFAPASNGSWIFSDAFACAGTLTLTRGSLDTNSQTVSCGTFASGVGNTRSLTLGTTVLTVTGNTSFSLAAASNLTLSAASSTITLSGSTVSFLAASTNGGPLAFGTVNITGAGVAVYQGHASNTFVNFNRTGTAVKTDGLSLASDLGAVSGTLTLAGNSATNRLHVKSNTIGTARTITNNGTLTASHLDLQDITGAGSTAWSISAITGLSGDCGGNSNITFTTAQDNYWVADTGSWSDSSKWKLSDHSTAGRVPLPQDGVRFDASSFTTGSRTVTLDMPRGGKAINWTGATNTPTFASSTSPTIYGSITLIAAMNVTSANQWILEPRTSVTLTTAGISQPHATTMQGPGGTVTLLDAYVSTAALTLIGGTFDAATFAVTATAFSITASSTRSIQMGTGTWTATGTGTIWNAATTTGLTFNAGTSTIAITDASGTNKTFAGGGLTYYNVTITTGGAGKVIYTGSNTFRKLAVTGGGTKTINFTAGTTTTLTTTSPDDAFFVGAASNLITLDTDTGAGVFTLSKSAGRIVSDYLHLTRSAATGGAAWYAGANSTNNGSNTGWVFSAPPTVRPTTNLLMGV